MIDHGLERAQECRKCRAKLGAVLSQEDWKEVPDLNDQGLILLGLDNGVVFTGLPQAELALLVE